MPRTKSNPSANGKRPSMYDVARLAGVSQTTVSFVVNNVVSANIASETRDRVWAAVKQLGWRPNAMARGLRTRLSRTIGLISDEVVTSPHAVKIIQGAQDTAWANENMLLVVNTGGSREVEQAALDVMLERQVDGLIYAAMYHHAVEPLPAINSVPTVLVNCFVADRALPSVVPDEVQGGYTATELLLRKGHRRIGLINDNDPIPATVGRLAGYTQALAAYGLSVDPSLIATGPAVAAGGYQAAHALLQLPTLPSAIFCFNDSMAMGAYDAIKKAGLSIPQDIALVGFDNQELIAAQLYPTLTTVELPHYEMGRWAIEFLLQHGDTQPLTPRQQLMRCPLIERESV